MLEVNIPSFKSLKIKNIVFDYNGTLATDGEIGSLVKDSLDKLSEFVSVYVITADTYGTVRNNLKDGKLKIQIISEKNGAKDKLDFVEKLGTEGCIAIGNGNNDYLMLKESALGICILGEEGAGAQALQNCDIIFKNIIDCFTALLNTKRLKATLRG